MSIQKLRYIVAAIELESHAKAAEQLIISPQAITKAIADKEKQLGRKLFERNGRGVKPTSFGLLFAERAREVIENYDDLETLGSEDSETTASGKLTIALSVTPFRGEVYDESALGEFAHAFPLVDTRILRRASDTCLRALKESIADAAILIGRVAEDGYVCTRIGSISPGLLAHRDAKPHSRTKIGLDELSGTPLAFPDDIRYVLPTIQAHFNALGLPSPHFQHVEPTEDGLYHFLKTGGVVFSAPNNSLIETHEDLEIVPLASKHSITLPVYLIYRTITPELRRLRDHLFSPTITSR
ncbi:LysR family transcriptional regulator [Adlercreutzia sp. R25]|uniref:LysR family transcriptional regulator n=1 Tax=Adlercreutzia shanghongiae TaxID=3111773 RepID=A0ABU6IYQ2_9ACTN|nr:MULTISPECIES: LysR family transcriptional regulator [unclassified Adlercreutzia]MEC4271617.1 LysR family transcriptional regulator [Adlercreutzia sp. R25]MEC4294624.1 LysR family transcriptional regulator [Adlercreutzia sp. R22]